MIHFISLHKESPRCDIYLTSSYFPVNFPNHYRTKTKVYYQKRKLWLSLIPDRPPFIFWPGSLIFMTENFPSFAFVIKNGLTGTQGRQRKVSVFKILKGFWFLLIYLLRKTVSIKAWKLPGVKTQHIKKNKLCLN